MKSSTFQTFQTFKGSKLEIGARVRADGKHWLRPLHAGTIVEYDERRRANPWLVKFDQKFPGGGIDGSKLYLSADHLTVLDESETSKSSKSSKGSNV